jgi:hypothetical protein
MCSIKQVYKPKRVTDKVTQIRACLESWESLCYMAWRKWETITVLELLRAPSSSQNVTVGFGMCLRSLPFCTLPSSPFTLFFSTTFTLNNNVMEVCCVSLRKKKRWILQIAEWKWHMRDTDRCSTLFTKLDFGFLSLSLSVSLKIHFLISKELFCVLYLSRKCHETRWKARLPLPYLLFTLSSFCWIQYHFLCSAEKDERTEKKQEEREYQTFHLKIACSYIYFLYTFLPLFTTAWVWYRDSESQKGWKSYSSSRRCKKWQIQRSLSQK